jgi:hypothetical protein
MYERRHQPLLPASQFYLRVLRAVIVTCGILFLTVLVGAIGLHVLEHMAWIDAVLNAVLIMTGLGLTVTLQSAAAKVFTSFYAILSAIIFFACIMILFSPLIHRALHHFHLDLEKSK